jgi:hypothetical protein
MNSFPGNINPRICELIAADCNGTVTEQEMQELEMLLEADPVSQEFYVDFLNVNAELLWLMSARERGTKVSAAPPISTFLGDWARFFSQHSPFSYVFLFFVLCATVAGTVFVSTHIGNVGKTDAEAIAAAHISFKQDCQWSATSPAPAADEPLRVGQQLRLDGGIVQLTYSNGAIVLLQGPADFRIDSANSGFLGRGKLTAQADSQRSREFTIATRDARFVDLGTEFGVMIDESGRTEAAVFEGKVNAEAKLADGRWNTPVALGEGEAVVCENRNFTPLVAQRTSFPTLKPLPPPPPDVPFQRWLSFSQDVRKRKDLLTYYDFQPDENDSKVLVNRAQTGAELNGKLEGATWVDGRFPGKKALEFKKPGDGVHINIPQELTALTFIAWINVDTGTNRRMGLLMSDEWTKPLSTRWFMDINRTLKLSVQNEQGDSANGRLGRSSIRTWRFPEDQNNHWCMVAVVYAPNGRQVRHFLNGAFVDGQSGNAPAIFKIGSAMIGTGNSEGQNTQAPEDQTLNGRMDELMIFSKWLSSEQIRTIYEAGKP